MPEVQPSHKVLRKLESKSFLDHSLDTFSPSKQSFILRPDPAAVPLDGMLHTTNAQKTPIKSTSRLSSYNSVQNTKSFQQIRGPSPHPY